MQARHSAFMALQQPCAGLVGAAGGFFSVPPFGLKHPTVFGFSLQYSLMVIFFMQARHSAFMALQQPCAGLVGAAGGFFSVPSFGLKHPTDFGFSLQYSLMVIFFMQARHS